MVQWLQAHKAVTGVVVTVGAGVLAALPYPWAATAFHYIIVLGPSLIAAGILPSDFHVQQAQQFAATGQVDKRA